MRKSIPKVPNKGEVFKAIGQDWTLYKIDDEQYKLVANQPIEGHANYSLVIKNNRVEGTKDGARLRSSRALFEAVEAALGGPESLPKDDKYGDVAIRSGRPLTDEQKWNRHLLNMRLTWLDHQCNPNRITQPFTIELAINARYTPIYGKPTQEVIDAVKAYVFRGVAPNPETLLSVKLAYYGGEFAPNPMEQLDMNLDLITGVL